MCLNCQIGENFFFSLINARDKSLRVMKFALAALAFALTSSIALADIQATPASDQGPTRKLGRGIGNIAFGSSEILDSISSVNYFEGNSAAFSYGLVRGIGRTLARMGYGVYEVLLFPFPTQKGTYFPPYRSNIPWINSGYDEFPPELGFETRYQYNRDYQRTW
jgi:putative exosortase-associated protein (TIGR04073 family)